MFIRVHISNYKLKIKVSAIPLFALGLNLFQAIFNFIFFSSAPFGHLLDSQEFVFSLVIQEESTKDFQFNVY